MSQPDLARLIEAHKEEIVRETVQGLLAAKVLPPTVNAESMERTTIIRTDAIIEYLQTGDLESWRSKIQQRGQTTVQQGIATQSVNRLSEIGFTVLKKVLERYLSGPQNEELRNRYFQRLDSLRTMTDITAINGHLANQLHKPDNKE